MYQSIDFYNLIVNIYFIAVQPKMLNNSNVFSKSIGESIRFNCSADGIPRPNLLWYRNNNLLLNFSRFHITYSEDQVQSIRFATIPEVQQARSTLTITRLRSSDSGNIECRADNSAGQTKKVTNILNIIEGKTFIGFRFIFILNFHILQKHHTVLQTKKFVKMMGTVMIFQVETFTVNVQKAFGEKNAVKVSIIKLIFMHGETMYTISIETICNNN